MRLCGALPSPSHLSGKGRRSGVRQGAGVAFCMRKGRLLIGSENGVQREEGGKKERERGESAAAVSAGQWRVALNSSAQPGEVSRFLQVLGRGWGLAAC